MARFSSRDTFGRPIDFSYPWGMDFRAALLVSQAEGVEYSLSGKEVTFRIRDIGSESGVFLLDQNTSSGNISISGSTVLIDIPFSDIDISGIVEGGRYEYGITIGSPIDGNRIQGLFLSMDEAGPVDGGYSYHEISLSDISVDLNLSVGQAGQQGEQGPAGPAGPWQTEARAVSSSGDILATDTVLFVSAASGDVELSCPDPSSLFDGSSSRVITIARPMSDTGNVSIVGTSPDLPFDLFPSESVYITSTDGISIVVSDAPFILNVITTVNERIGDVLLPASEELSGMPRYREGAGGSSFSVCMQNPAGGYEWVDLVELV